MEGKKLELGLEKLYSFIQSLVTAHHANVGTAPLLDLHILTTFHRNSCVNTCKCARLSPQKNISNIHLI